MSFTRSGMGDSSCALLCNALKTRNSLKMLTLSGCHLTALGATAVGHMLQARIKHHDEQQMSWREESLMSFGGLNQIKLNHNPEIGDEGVKIITDALMEDNWLKKLDLRHTGLTNESAAAINELICINPLIRYINLESNILLSTSWINRIKISLQKRNRPQ